MNPTKTRYLNPKPGIAPVNPAGKSIDLLPGIKPRA